MKKLISLTLIVAAVVICSAGSKAQAEQSKLSDPNDLKVTSQAYQLLVQWQSVKDAKKYVIKIQGNAEYNETGQQSHYTVEVEFNFESSENNTASGKTLSMGIKIQKLFELVAEELKNKGYSEPEPDKTSLKQGTAKIKALAEGFLDSDFSDPVIISDIHFQRK